MHSLFVVEFLLLTRNWREVGGTVDGETLSKLYLLFTVHLSLSFRSVKIKTETLPVNRTSPVASRVESSLPRPGTLNLRSHCF